MSMNIHEAGIYESERETDRQKQTEGESRKHKFANTQSKSEYYANIRSLNQPNTEIHFSGGVIPLVKCGD